MKTLLLAAALTAQSNWVEDVRTDLITDSINVTLMTSSIDGNRDVGLGLRCQENKTEVIVMFSKYLYNEPVKVSYRLGTSTPKSGVWSYSTKGDALFVPSPIRFIKQMMAYDSLTVRATDYQGSQETVKFNIKGLREEISTLRKTCNW